VLSLPKTVTDHEKIQYTLFCVLATIAVLLCRLTQNTGTPAGVTTLPVSTQHRLFPRTAIKTADTPLGDCPYGYKGYDPVLLCNRYPGSVKVSVTTSGATFWPIFSTPPRGYPAPCRSDFSVVTARRTLQTAYKGGRSTISPGTRTRETKEKMVQGTGRLPNLTTPLCTPSSRQPARSDGRVRKDALFFATENPRRCNVPEPAWPNGRLFNRLPCCPVNPEGRRLLRKTTALTVFGSPCTRGGCSIIS